MPVLESLTMGIPKDMLRLAIEGIAARIDPIGDELNRRDGDLAHDRLL